MKRYIGLWVLILSVGSGVPAAVSQDTISPATSKPAETAPPAKAQESIPIDEEAIPPVQDADPSDEISLGEVPIVEMVDLTLDSAKRAVEAYVLLREKYKDAQFENFETLQEFVEKDPQGRAFEADVKAAGFDNVTLWNQMITTVSSAYANIVDDQSADIKLQIEEVQKDAELAQDMKDRIVASLNALIPSENNRKVVQSMIDDPVMNEKLKLLETEEE